MGVVALLTVLHHRKVYVPQFQLLPELLLMAGKTERITFRDQELVIPGGMRLMAEDAGALSRGGVCESHIGKRSVILVALKANLRALFCLDQVWKD